jgi:hypothetical protein
MEAPLPDVDLDALTDKLAKVAVKPKRLLVLDLNGLFVHRVYRADAPRDLDTSQAVAVGKFWAWKRPHTDAFVVWALDHFAVGVWSSAMQVNVSGLITLVFGTRRSELLFELDQGSCVSVPHPHTTKKPLFKKPLARVWKLHPSYEGQTLLIDDSPLKAADNPPHVLFCPAEWTRECTDVAVNGALDKGGAIRGWLEALLECEGDVASFVQSREKADKSE